MYNKAAQPYRRLADPNSVFYILNTGTWSIPTIYLLHCNKTTDQDSWRIGLIGLIGTVQHFCSIGLGLLVILQ